MARAEDRTGTWMIIHQVTATYLVPPHHDADVGENLSNWNQYPLLYKERKNMQGYLWDLTKKENGSYLISTNQQYDNTGKHLYLEASSKTDTEKSAVVRQQYQRDNELQNWILEPVSNDNKTYAIRPKIFENHALGLINNDCTYGRRIIINCTYGKPTYHHYWRLAKPIY